MRSIREGTDARPYGGKASNLDFLCSTKTAVRCSRGSSLCAAPQLPRTDSPASLRIMRHAAAATHAISAHRANGRRTDLMHSRELPEKGGLAALRGSGGAAHGTRPAEGRSGRAKARPRPRRGRGVAARRAFRARRKASMCTSAQVSRISCRSAGPTFCHPAGVVQHGTT